jgi:5'-methylthioadenosine phosphorylase
VTQSILGIIGGSGVYDVPMDNARWESVSSPWGAPSDQLRRGEINGLPVVFLPRHGRGHVFSPSTINYRANIDVLKRAGVTDVISLSAVGSLREDLPPGTFVVVDQFIDRTTCAPVPSSGQAASPMFPSPVRFRPFWQDWSSRH